MTGIPGNSSEIPEQCEPKGRKRDVPGGPGGGSSSAAPRPLDGDFSICGGGPASRCPPSPLTAAQQRRRQRQRPRWSPGAAAARDNRGSWRALRRGRLRLMRAPPGCSSGRGCESSAPALPIQSQCDARRCEGCSAWRREGWRRIGLTIIISLVLGACLPTAAACVPRAAAALASGSRA